MIQTGVFGSPNQVTNSTALLFRIPVEPPVNATLIVNDPSDLRVDEAFVPGNQYVWYDLSLVGEDGVNVQDTGLRCYKLKPNRMLEFTSLDGVFNAPTLPDAMELASFLVIVNGNMSDVVYGKVHT